jgi:hypothetical protein
MDLTVIYYTLNKTPKGWQDFYMAHLKKSIGKAPVISVSRKPIDFGINLIDKEPSSYANIYRQILRAAKLAKTKYVATAEDDCLYSKEHYKQFRPKDDEFSYNRARWSVFAWEGKKAIYCLRQRISNCSLIAPTKLLIEALEERFKRYEGQKIPRRLMGECGRNKLERRMGITLRKQKDWWSTCPIIHLNHTAGTDGRQADEFKLHGQLKAMEIPYWGKASDIARQYKD